MPEQPIVRDKPDDRPDAPEIDQRSSPPGAPRAEPMPGQPDAQRAAGQGKAGKPAEPKQRSKLPLIILGIVIVLTAIGGTVYWWTTRNEQSTDDAYTDGHAISIAPQVAGIALKLAVTDNQFLHAGDLLVQIDPRDYQAARDQAE